MPMPRTPVILIADRSRLAANLYRLIFAPIGANLLVRSRATDILDHLKRGAAVDIIMVSTNALGPQPEDVISRIESDARASGLPKIFLCRETKGEELQRGRLAGLSNSRVVTRPFDPDELAKLVKVSVKGAGR